MKVTVGLGVCALVLLTLVTGCPQPCDGPDPQATSITYLRVSTTTETSGIVRITGIVTNRGSLPYVSGEDQQSLNLYEGDQLISTEDFTDLDVGETVEVSFERLWSSQDEFRRPTYTNDITYDPDIYIDENEQNDDCNVDNNERIRSTVGLDALFPD